MSGIRIGGRHPPHLRLLVRRLEGEPPRHVRLASLAPAGLCRLELCELLASHLRLRAEQLLLLLGGLELRRHRRERLARRGELSGGRGMLLAEVRRRLARRALGCAEAGELVGVRAVGGLLLPLRTRELGQQAVGGAPVVEQLRLRAARGS